MALKDLSINNTAAWPAQYKIAFCALIGVVIVGLAWYFLVADQRTELAGLERQEGDLRTEFEQKQGRAANLEPLKLQLTQMEQQLQQMLRQLPSKTEMPDLIIDISQTALATGISNELFQPGPEAPKEFYAEKPISLRMVGTYHQFGAFVSGVASLPRVVIMTMHDISLTPRNPTAGGKIGPNSILQLAGTVKTYRYLDEDETANATPAPAPAPQGGN
jgi:type IV pilus assembly protein PilO